MGWNPAAPAEGLDLQARLGWGRRVTEGILERRSCAF